MSKGAKKTGGSNRRAKDSAFARAMADAGVKRTTFRDPITYAIRGIGSYPGQSGKIQG